MKIILLSTVVILLVQSSTFAQLNADQESTLSKLIVEKKIPGLSLTIIRNGNIQYSNSFGTTGKENVNNETLFQAASLSKLPTAILFLLNDENNLIDIEGEVNQYLKSNILEGHKSNPTVIPSSLSLISHTGGMNIGGFLGYKRTRKNLPTIEDILDGKNTFFWEPKIKVKSPVNYKYNYSGGGYCYLQKIMEDVKVKTFEEVIKEEVLHHLEMTSSSYSFEPSKKANYAMGHKRLGKVISGKYRLYPQKAAAGLWTTSYEYANVLVAILEGLNKKKDSFLSFQSANKIVQPTRTANGRINNYGLGVNLEFDNNQNVVSIFHGGQNYGYTSFFYLNLKTKSGYVFFTNKHKADIDAVKWLIAESIELY